MNIYEKIETIRVELASSNLKKSGKNSFANFEYFTLDDFIPKINELMLKHKLFSNFSIEANAATLTFINIEKMDEQVIFKSPIADAEIKGTTPIQCLGGVHTYMRRYLYLNAFEIVEPDMLDAIAGSDMIQKKNQETITNKQIVQKPNNQPQQKGLNPRITEMSKLTQQFPEWDRVKIQNWIISTTGLDQGILKLTDNDYRALVNTIKSSRPLTQPNKEEGTNE